MGLGANAFVFALTTAAFASGCASQDIPQAYRGRMFDRTGPLALYTGKTGFTGPVLGPGTYFTATYNEIHKVECSTLTVREPLTALTKDGVRFGLNVDVRFSPDCTDDGIKTLLQALPVDEHNSVTAARVYQTYVQPAVGEAVRDIVWPLRASEVSDRREEILADVRRRLVGWVAIHDRHVAVLHEVDMSNLDGPPLMQQASTDRAVDSVLRDKAVAERDLVAEQIKTADLRRVLAEKEGMIEATRIAQIGEALRRYPWFLQFELQARAPGVYRQAFGATNFPVSVVR